MTLTIESLAAQINEQATTHPIGALQQLRTSVRGKRSRTRKIFHKLTTFQKYAFHDGGRTELQYNIGIESREDGDWWRHGLAFSFEPGQSLPNPMILLPKLDCFNEWMRLHDSELARFKMWHWAGPNPSLDQPPCLISDDFVRSGVFVFLGLRWREFDLDVEQILNDFDSLLPLYEFVERTARQMSVAVSLPEEVLENVVYYEGGAQQILINRYERDIRARKKCIDYYGTKCFVCGFNFAEVYGEVADGFIHVHHLIPLSEVNAEYIVDPIVDLRPLCPNCHAVVHRKTPPLSIEQVRNLLNSQCK